MRQVFIYGSCVSRDPFAFIPNDFKIENYVARSSFGSAFAERPFAHSLDEIDSSGAIKSAFQRSMVELDFNKGLRQRLMQIDPASTPIVIDLIDERFNLLILDGTIATYSAELQVAKPLDHYPGAKLVQPNSDQHFTYWMEGFSRFAALATGMKLKVILNKVFWAERSDDGGLFNAVAVSSHNDHLRRMYSYIEDRLPCQVVDYGSGAWVSAADHKWGPSPFHYPHHIYERLISHLEMS